MGRPAKSLRELQLSGTYELQKKRYRHLLNRKPSKSPPLGDPPQHFDIAEAYCWRQFKEEFPWVDSSDAALVEMASRLRARLMCGVLPIRDFNALRMLVIQLGGTALTRERMRTIADEDDSGASDLFG